jgi:hypothetical protein
MSSSPEYEEFAAEVLTCRRGPSSGEPCPIRNIHARGHFPKFGAGNPRRPRVAIVTQNPGRPTGVNDPGATFMQELYESELLLYLSGGRGATVDLVAEFRWVGLDFRCDGYFTEASRCVGGDTAAPSVAFDHCGGPFPPGGVGVR